MLGYRACVDAPTCDLYQELMTIYPSAKVILNTRDSAAVWWRSFSTTLLPQAGPLFGILTFPVKFLREQRRLLVAIKEKQDALEENGFGIKWYDRHVREVRERVPAERLLEFNVKEGWAPLCDFLGVEVPEEPFPHL